MRIIAGESYVEFQPETEWEVTQLARLDIPRATFTTELVEAPGDSYPPTMKKGAKLRVHLPNND